MVSNKMVNTGFVAIVIVIAFIVGFMLVKKTDSFDITVDPLRVKYEYESTSTEKYPRAKRYGLNTENDNNVDICSFNDKFNSKTRFIQNENKDPYALTARQYCSVLYSHHQELFNNLYSGLGECEKVETEKCRECPNRLDITKENDVYYTQLNRGV